LRNDKAQLLFRRLIDKARALGAKASLLARQAYAKRPRAVLAGTLAGVAGVAALSLAASASVNDGQFLRSKGKTLDGYLRAAFGLSPYALSTTERAAQGLQGWTPTGMPGWEVYDISTPRVITRNLSADEARLFNALVTVTTTPVEPMKPFLLDANASDEERAILCLTQAIYYEAGFEPGEGQQAVAQVVLNRVRHPAYPKSVCGVVYQGSQRVTGCQFSFTCDGSLTRPPAIAAWERSRQVARAALSGFVYKQVGTATHYHADYVFPYWAPTLVKLKQIGAHIFYRMTGPAGSPDGFGGRYAGNEAVLSTAVLTGGDARTPDAPSMIQAAPAAPLFQTVSLTIDGQTRNYQVGATPFAPPSTPAGAATTAAGAPNAAVLPRPDPMVVQPGVLVRTRRQATSDEINEINAKLKAYEDSLPPLARAPAPIVDEAGVVLLPEKKR